MTEPVWKVVIADDEPMARVSLVDLLGRHGDVRLVGEAHHGLEAVELVRSVRPELLFLDVQMPGLDGLRVLQELGDASPEVVFTTAFEQYALAAFDVHAVDYLLKPFDDARFDLALERARARLRERRGLTEARDESAFPDRITIHREGQIELIDVRSIRWVQAADQYVRIHAEDGAHLMRASMAEVEGRLDPERFARVHRSAIVALDRIARLVSASGGNGEVALKDGTRVPVSRSRIPGLRARLG